MSWHKPKKLKKRGNTQKKTLTKKQLEKQLAIVKEKYKDGFKL